MLTSSYLFKSNPAAFTEPFTGAKAFSVNFAKRKTHDSAGIFTDFNVKMESDEGR